MALKDLKGVLPAQQITGRFQHAGRLAAAFVYVLAAHLRQPASLTLSRAFVAVFELV